MDGLISGGGLKTGLKGLKVRFYGICSNETISINWMFLCSFHKKFFHSHCVEKKSDIVTMYRIRKWHKTNSFHISRQWFSKYILDFQQGELDEDSPGQCELGPIVRQVANGTQTAINVTQRAIREHSSQAQLLCGIVFHRMSWTNQTSPNLDKL